MRSVDPRFISIPAKGATQPIEASDILVTFYGKRGGGSATHLTREAAQTLIERLQRALAPDATFPVTIEVQGPPGGPPCLWAQGDGSLGESFTAKRFETAGDAEAFAKLHEIANAVVIA